MYGKPIPKAVMLESAKHAATAARLLSDAKRVIREAGSLTHAEQGLYSAAIYEATQELDKARETLWRNDAAERAAEKAEREKNATLTQANPKAWANGGERPALTQPRKDAR